MKKQLFFNFFGGMDRLKHLYTMLLAICFSSIVAAQCPNDNTQFGTSTPTCDGNTQTLTSCIFGGEYRLVNLDPNTEYTFSTCSDTDFDTQMTIYDNVTGAVVGYNDDFCGLQSQVTFTTGASPNPVRVLIDEFNCLSNSSCMTLDVTCNVAVIGDPPVLMCPMDIVVDNSPGACGATVGFSPPFATDTEDGIIVSTQTGGLPSGSLFPVGTSVVEFTATDSDGNSTSCTFNVIVNDAEDPTVACQDITVELDDMGMYSLTPAEVIASSSDNCAVTGASFEVPLTLTTGQVPFNFDGTGIIDTDAVIAAAPNTFGDVTVAVEYAGDFGGTFEALVIEGPDGSTVLNDAVAGSDCTTFTASFTVAAATWNNWVATYGPDLTFTSQTDTDVDNICTDQYFQLDATLSSQSSTLDLTCANVGPNNVTVYVTDAAGNTANCVAVVTVEDNTAPVITCIGEPATITGTTTTNPGINIVDNTTVSATFDVTDDVTIADLDVALDITHTWTGDLIVTLESPTGTQVTIFDGNADGCSGDNIQDTYDDESANALDCQAGTPDAFPLDDYIPSNPLSAFDGEGTLGTWTIFVEDDAGGDTGVLNSVSLIYSYDVTGVPLDVVLDANGMATINASDLLLSVDEACGYVVTTVGTPPVAGSLGTLFNSNNGGSTGGAVYFDITVGPEDITITDLDINTAEAGAFTMDVYTLVGSYVGNEGDAGAWTLSSPSSGTSAGDDNPSNAVLDNPIALAAGTTYGMALVLDASHGHEYSGTGTDPAPGNTSYSNADLTLSLGSASNVPFDGAPFTPRIFNGNINYFSGGGASPTIDLDCSMLGENQIDIQVTDDSGNVAICTATVNVLDETSPILVCQDITLPLDENGMATIEPEDLLAEGPTIYNALVIGSDNGSGTEGTTDFTVDVTEAATLSFDWDYTSNDVPGFDSFGYVINGTYTQLTDPGLGNQSGTASVSVAPGDVFGFRSQTDDNSFGNNETVVSNFAPGFDGQFDPLNWTLNLVNSDGDAFFVIEIPGGPLSYDACGITVLAIDIDEFDCDDIGTPITVTVFASDASGNLAACTAVVTVVDDLAPEITCPADQTVDPGPNNLFYEVPDYWGTGEATATDNCTDPVSIFTQDPAPGDLLPDGTYTVTLTAEDEYGNVGTCTFELIVESQLGTDDNVLANSVALYPNPAVSTVTLSNGKGLQLDTAAIYDIDGKLVRNIDLSSMGTEKSIDVSNLASGVYLVQIQGENGSTVKRLIKK